MVAGGQDDGRHGAGTGSAVDPRPTVSRLPVEPSPNKSVYDGQQGGKRIDRILNEVRLFTVP